MKKLVTDVAIVGAGCGGLACALTVAENGINTVIFEKSPKIGGVSNGGMGFFAVESKYQRAMQISFKREDAFKLFLERSLYQVNAPLISDFVNRSAEMIEWIEDLGGAFGEVVAYIDGGNMTWHQHMQDTANFTDLIWMQAEKAGAKLYLNTAVKKLKKVNGKVIGLTAESADGEIIDVEAKAVLIATGGFASNPEMVNKYTKFTVNKNLITPPVMVPVEGDGLNMAWEIGAEKGHMIFDACSSTSPFFGGPGGMMLQCFRQPNLIVNLDGERFMDESIIKHGSKSINAINMQRDGIAFMILDESIEKHYEDVGYDYVLPGNGFAPGGKSPGGTVETITKSMKKGIPVLFAADSIDELCGMTGINKENLKMTLDEYNGMCITGRDGMFHKAARYLRPITKPKFLCGRLLASGYGTLGGISINRKCEVLDTEKKIIPGLYCAGTDCNDISGDAYTFEMPGLTSGFAYYTGRKAGESMLGAQGITPKTIRRNLTPDDVPKPEPFDMSTLQNLSFLEEGVPLPPM